MGICCITGAVIIGCVLVRHPDAPRVDREGDMTEGLTLLIISVVLFVVSWRWCRFAVSGGKLHG